MVCKVVTTGRSTSRRMAENVAPRPAAIDPELMLQTDHVEAVEPKEVHRLLIVAQALLLDLEPHFRRVVVAFRHVIDGQHRAFRTGY